MQNDPGFKKYKMIYSGELILISLVFLVLGILKLLGVMPSKQPRMMIFNWITMIGGLWIIIDLIWMIISKKRRKKNCILDKIINVFIPLFLIPFDIYCLFINKEIDPKIFSYCVGGVFIYVFLDYTFQGIYHFFKPLPSLINAYELEKKEVALKLEEARKQVEEKEIKEDKEKENNQ